MHNRADTWPVIGHCKNFGYSTNYVFSANRSIFSQTKLHQNATHQNREAANCVAVAVQIRQANKTQTKYNQHHRGQHRADGRQRKRQHHRQNCEHLASAAGYISNGINTSHGPNTKIKNNNQGVIERCGLTGSPITSTAWCKMTMLEIVLMQMRVDRSVHMRMQVSVRNIANRLDDSPSQISQPKSNQQPGSRVTAKRLPTLRFALASRRASIRSSRSRPNRARGPIRRAQ